MVEKSINNEENSCARLNRKEFIGGLFAVLLTLGFITFFSISRKLFTWGTEADYLATYIPEAERFLNNSPLELRFHPPFYAITIAFIKSLIKDWFATGLFVSWVSSVIVLIGYFVLFFHLGGRSAAWGSLVTLSTSKVFLRYSTLATSDMFFLALYSSCLFLVFVAMKRKSIFLWTISGIALGLSLLTRSNSITLLVLLICPLVLVSSVQIRRKSLLWFSFGLVSIIIIWVWVAKSTNSPLIPRENHTLLAMTYFAEGNDRFTEDAATKVLGKFNNVVDVLTYDPIRIVKVYAMDFYNMLRRIFSPEIIAFPMYLFALPGLLIFSVSHTDNSNFFRILVVATIFQLLLVNFKMFEKRYSLFIIPFLGAGAGICIEYIWNLGTSLPFAKFRFPLIMVLLFLLLSETSGSLKYVHSYIHASEKELSEAVPLIKHKVPQECGIVSRSVHIPYYSQRKWLFFPLVDGLDSFRDHLDTWREKGCVYIYYGSRENKTRPDIIDLRNPENGPSWLRVVAQSEPIGDWALYMFDPHPLKDGSGV